MSLAPDDAGATLAPPFMLPCATNCTASTFSLSSLAGKIILVHFWATFAEPSKKSLLMLEDVSRTHPEVAVVAIAEDDASTSTSDVAAFAASRSATFPILRDPDNKTAAAYRPATIPATFIVDRAGAIRAVLNGYHDGEEATLVATISSL